MAEHDTAEATFAFVDLAGFAVLTEMCGDQVAASLAGRLGELARDSLGPGVAIVKAIGDAVMLRASRPEQMVATILTLAERAADEDGFLALRTGIHHGSAVHLNGDYVGHGVNVAARITALAGAGQAVVTEHVRQACAQLGLPADPLGSDELPEPAWMDDIEIELAVIDGGILRDHQATTMIAAIADADLINRS